MTVNTFNMTNLDRLRTEGVVFTRAYCSAPMCSPSRYSTITGRYPSRCVYSRAQTVSGCSTTTTDVTVPNSRLDGDYDTANNIATALKAVDPEYVTGTFGKWHLSGDSKVDMTKPGHVYKAQALAKTTGFDVAGGIYYENIERGGGFAYSHNLEYMV